MCLSEDIDFHGTENLLNNTMQDQKKFPTKTVLRFSKQRHIPLFPDRVTHSVREEIKLCKWNFR